VVTGAKITISSPNVPQPLETVSDDSGNFIFPQVPIGTYLLTATKAGFSTVRQQNLVVKLGSRLSYSPRLEVGQISQIVEVTDAAESLDVTSSRTSTNITSRTFDNLPKGRTFNSILLLAPGVRQETKNGGAGVGGFQVDGASGSENSFIVDGVDVSDVRRGSLRQQSAIPLEFVQEVQVKSGGFEAEFGGATGGVINVATKGGTNEYHGQAFFQFTNSGLNAGDRGYWQRSVANAAVAEFFKPKEDDYRILYPGGVIAGPILKNRLFFFGSFAPELERTTRNIAYAAGARSFEQDQKRYYGLGRLDFAPTTRLQVNSSFIWSPTKIIGYLASRDSRLAAPSQNLGIQGGYAPVKAFTSSVVYTLTSKLVVSGRYGYRYMNDKGGSGAVGGNYGLSTLPFITYNNSAQAITGLPPELRQGTGYRNVNSTLANLRDITTRNNLYLDASYTTGRHTFKGGYNLARLSNDTLNDYTNGRFVMYWNEAFSRASVQNVRGTYGYYIWEDGVKNTGNVNSRNQGFYLQDAWRVNARLTLNLGVRFENEFLPPYKPIVNGRKVANPVSFDWGSKIAPRIGGAYDPLGDGKWKIYGSYGLFYDVLKYEIARGSFGSDVWVSNVYKLDNLNLLSLGNTTPGALGERITSYDNRTLPINAAGEIEGIDPNLKPFSTREFTVGVDRALASRLVAGVRYTRRDLRKAIEDIGVLDAEGSEVYLTGNPGFGLTRNTKSEYGGKTPNGQEFLVPKAVRRYDGVEFRLQGQTRSLTYIGSYTWSRLYGNYSGAANSDESGRSDPGVSRAFDLPYYYFDATGSQQNVLGPLGTDRPHTFKFFGSYDMKSKAGLSTLGLNQIAYSGTPDSTSIIFLSAPTFPFGRGDLGRTPVLTQTDLSFSHTFSFTERLKAKFDFNVINLFNQAAVISRTTQMNRSGAISDAALPLSKFFAGYNPQTYLSQNGGVVNGVSTIPVNPIYRLPAGNYRNGGGPDGTADRLSSAFAASFPGFGAYQDFRAIRLGFKFIF
ncbi:MAG: TonB-dependent receptor, partial [Bryobacterales bacterium]|nr:TonB-dependent receptor [Bryobacterales bacterium]